MVAKAHGNKHRRLPRRLGKFFWDVYPDHIDLDRNAEYVIARLLEHGDLVAVRWVLRAYNKNKIAEVVKQSRQLSRKTANFWRLRLSIPRSEIYALQRRYILTSPEPFY